MMDSKHIINRVNNLKTTWFDRYDREPYKLFVGDAEYNEIRALAKEYSMYHYPGPYQHESFMCLKLIRVKEYKFLAVGNCTEE